MAIETGELKYYLTGTATSDESATSTPAASLGGFRSSSEVGSGDNNLFDDVAGADAEAGLIEYRCVCIKNTDGALDLTDAVIYLSDDDIGGSNTVAFAVEVPTTSDTTGSCQTIANETTVPSTIGSGNVSDWSTVTTYATGIGLDIATSSHDEDLGAGELVFVWIRRTIAAGASAASAISLGIKIEGDTAA